MNSTLAIRLIFLFIFIIPFKIDGQYTEFGFGGGVSTYWGDLNNPSLSSNLVKNSGAALQLHLRKIFKNRIGVRASFVYGHIKGDDSNSDLDWQKERNLSFKSVLTEFALMGEYYLFGFDTEPGGTVFAPYLTAGISGFRFDPKTIYRGNEVRLQPLGTEGQSMSGFGNKYSLFSGALCFGGGAKFIISESVTIGLEVVMRRTFTDYLDDVSKSYVNYDDLSAGNGTLAANLGNRTGEYFGQTDPVQLPTGAQRGGAFIKDYYIVSMITVNMIIDSGTGRRKYNNSNKVVCPKF
ncbi:MAG: DUF6089 family protein [Saprospiraceae bacterium]